MRRGELYAAVWLSSLLTTCDRVPWLLDEFDYIFETSYDNQDPEEFSCEVSEPTRFCL